MAHDCEQFFLDNNNFKIWKKNFNFDLPVEIDENNTFSLCVFAVFVSKERSFFKYVHINKKGTEIFTVSVILIHFRYVYKVCSREKY